MAQQIPYVQPGDLLDSELWKQVVDELVSLREAVTALQATAVRVSISNITGPSPLHPGDVITIFGQGFVVPASLNAVTISGISTGDVSGISTQLVTRIPTALNVSAGGQYFEVAVSNARGSAKYQIFVMPQVIVPAGRTEVIYTVGPGAATIAANSPGSYIFGFKAVGYADRPGNYQVSLNSSDPAWTPVLLSELTDDPRSSNVYQLGADPNNGVPVDIRVRVACSGVGKTTLRVDLQEITPGTKVTPANTSLVLEAGKPPPTPNDSIRVALQGADGTATMEGTRVYFKPNTAGPGTLYFFVYLKDPGQYTVSTALSVSPGWGTPMLPISKVTGPTTTPPQLKVILAPDASAKPTDLIFTVRRDSDGFTAQYALQLMVRAS